MIFDPLLALFRGQAITIPPFDGALKPNARLEEAEVLAMVGACDNLAGDENRLWLSADERLLCLESGAGEPREVGRFPVAITALALSPAGELAIGLDDGTLVRRLPDGTVQPLVKPADLICPTALTFAVDGSLYVCQGSARHRASDWTVDLMEGGASGALWRLDPGGGIARLAGDLAFPYGILIRDDGECIVTESWRHRLISVPTNGGSPKPVLEKLPGYPARLAPADGGGAWLALFAPRNRLIEFTLRETDYRSDMMRDVPRDYWIAPALASGGSFLEPLQCGGVKTMGIHKPWSPTRSYGLAVRLNPKLMPEASFHSRANGRRHGVTSVVEWRGRAVAASKGGGLILDLGPVEGEGARP